MLQNKGALVFSPSMENANKMWIQHFNRLWHWNEIDCILESAQCQQSKGLHPNHLAPHSAEIFTAHLFFTPELYLITSYKQR